MKDKICIGFINVVADVFRLILTIVNSHYLLRRSCRRVQVVQPRFRGKVYGNAEVLSPSCSRIWRETATDTTLAPPLDAAIFSSPVTTVSQPAHSSLADAFPVPDGPGLHSTLPASFSKEN